MKSIKTIPMLAGAPSVVACWKQQPRAKSSFLLALALVGTAAIAPMPASACTVETFVTNLIDKRSAKIAVGQSVDLYVYFKIVVDSSSRIQSNSQIGSLKIDYGDGTAEDTGLQTFDPTVIKTWNFGGVPMKVFTHAYTRPGAFMVTVKGGKTQPCAIEPGLAPIMVNAYPVVVGLDTKRNVADRHALIPGKIEKAEMLLGGEAPYVQIHGSGTCSLKVYEELGGIALQQYDYKGPLPTTIWIRPSARHSTASRVYVPDYSYGTHILKIDGTKSSDGCAGTASATWTVQAPRPADLSGSADRAGASVIAPNSRNATLMKQSKAVTPAAALSPTTPLLSTPSPLGAGGTALAKAGSHTQIGGTALNQPVVQAPAAATRSRQQKADGVALNPLINQGKAVTPTAALSPTTPLCRRHRLLALASRRS